jgi:hypothetical protein
MSITPQYEPGVTRRARFLYRVALKYGLGWLLLMTAAACSGPYPLAQTQQSAEGVAREVLAAISRRDETRLRALALDEREFERRVWPGLPAARPERNVPWSYVWMDLRQKSDTMLARAISNHSGKAYELERVTFEGAMTDHGTYVIHREAIVWVRDAAGEQQRLRLMGSLIDAGGRWKVFSYVVDD